MNRRFVGVVQIVTSSILLFSLTSCHHPTEPPRPSPPDTTSHNFVWKIYLFGEGNPSYLKDAAIVSDTLAYAVGSIYSYDSTGQVNPEIQNLARWNGSTWAVQRVTVNFRGSMITPPIDGIFSASPTQFWLSAIGDVICGDGSTWITLDVHAITGFNELGFEKGWGCGPDEMWFVGIGGTITKYNSGAWQKIGSGTTVDLQDVWGTTDGATLWACGYLPNNFQSILLKYENGQWRTLWHRDGNNNAPPFGYNVTSVWRGSSTFVTTSNGVFRLDSDSTQTKMSDYFGAFAYRIRGNADNDFIVVGDGGMIWHYNGATWKQLRGSSMGQPLYSCAMKGNTIVAVGTDNSTFLSRALIVVGKRE